MPKYIDADALIKTESELLELRGLTTTAKVGHLYALSILTTAKPADVAPVRRTTIMRLALADGMPYRDERYDYVFTCDKCGHETLGLPYYCPQCGRMVDTEASDKRPD